MIHKAFCSAMAAYVATVFLLSNSVNSAYGSEYDKGKTLYDEKCAICHGADGKGNGPAAVALSPPPKDFNRAEFWKQKNVDQLIAQQVKNGKGAMPPFQLSEDEVNAIIDFMSHAFKH